MLRRKGQSSTMYICIFWAESSEEGGGGGKVRYWPLQEDRQAQGAKCYRTLLHLHRNVFAPNFKAFSSDVVGRLQLFRSSTWWVCLWFIPFSFFITFSFFCNVFMFLESVKYHKNCFYVFDGLSCASV